MTRMMKIETQSIIEAQIIKVTGELNHVIRQLNKQFYIVNNTFINRIIYNNTRIGRASCRI